MRFIATSLGTNFNPDASNTLLARVLRRIIPQANPEFEQHYGNVRLWWVETDEVGTPQRELGFGQDGVVLVAGPWGENVGFWTDSSMVFASGEYEAIDPAAFEANWSRFEARSQAGSAGEPGA